MQIYSITNILILLYCLFLMGIRSLLHGTCWEFIMILLMLKKDAGTLIKRGVVYVKSTNSFVYDYVLMLKAIIDK